MMPKVSLRVSTSSERVVTPSDCHGSALICCGM